jgi:bifunctional DNA-binding transcriptional regulator/antitoxin component of YhaV-PrlF toxin-antitoxin module
MVLVRKAKKTVVSTKGQVISPKTIRDSKGRGAGKELIVEARWGGVVLRAARPFAATKTEEVFGSFSHHGKRLSDQEIEKALSAAAKRRYARD